MRKQVFDLLEINLVCVGMFKNVGWRYWLVGSGDVDDVVEGRWLGHEPILYREQKTHRSTEIESEEPVSGQEKRPDCQRHTKAPNSKQTVAYDICGQ
ncbi:hypothetical protein SAMN06266787_12712 [Halorubrum ezzemoulense]|uniref:Uncharacterized protein n=1 Tax=Halorubrum ezzemoulense TaxID=337243 RepID=A0A238Z4Q9_HALEZ|nr:hypothetical protein SAMN06266787_12712 [Halorubrum ezzemoulense]